MGLEWHNRKRSMNGRFAKREKALQFYTGVLHTQFHIRVPADLAERVRRIARENEQEIGEFGREALQMYCDFCEEEG